ncbi:MULTISPECIES: outer membrane protein [unclassified Chelatococcus]|uniref:outer membrane protein n=1 Tax=unclassified Chelatococcus TaxID=2638111 RepID=UPI00030672EB|nr:MULTISPECIES: outer membrane protein [unclassified Chelatococcus]ALA17935.1 hypothetical protein AL346_11575 [Chelatococcus sp. CO-6]
MKNLLRLSAAAAALALSGAVAFAADLPSRTYTPPAEPLPPVFTWTGFYVGVNAGYGFSDSGNTRYVGDALYLDSVGVGDLPGSLSLKSEGFLGGAQVGYNYQFGAFVVGLEADIQYADMSDTGTSFAAAGFAEGKKELEWFGTLRARLGFAAMDRLLIFATGGLIYGDTKLTHSVFDTTGALLAVGSKSDTQAGWTIGGGLEYAFTNNLTAKAEYLYYDLGDTTAIAPNVVDPTTVAVLKAKNRGSIVRVGLNYKFDTF